MSVRIIPRLDIKGPTLVKGIHLEGLRALGQPEQFARLYYEHGADELLYMDVVASLYGRNSLLDTIERTASEVFIPLTVGGGIRTLDDIRAVLRAGADKVAINTAAIRQPEFVREAARRFGSSSIVVAIEAIQQADGTYEAFVEAGRERTGRNAVEWAHQAADLGAGELLIVSVDREGTGHGFDVPLTRQVADAVPIPVIACGGAGRGGHVAEVITDGHADAVCVASLLHYGLLDDGQIGLDAGIEGNTEYLRRRSAAGRRAPSNIHALSLPDLKAHLASAGIACRSASPQMVAPDV